ncbi:MAG: FAD-dependent oxidoreductase [Rickettsiales bacterium]|jgi:thioredoxin reductase (NADPH)|nr:FAD-dependent oxidoreductase [Rickettsiales bacterium]
MIYDIMVLGSGPAGLTAALYGARANKKVLVVGGESLGGQMGEIPKLENYPGWEGSGMDLAEFMKKQAESFGASFVMGHCKNIEANGSVFSIRTDKNSYEAASVIIATGASPRKLEISGAREFTGKGVSYCATCDGFFYKDKIVAVYGGGNSAMNDALYLANLAKKVYIIYRKPSFTRAEAILVKRVEEAKNIECVFETEIMAVCGNESGVTHVDTNHESRITIDGLFIAIGHEANTDFLPEDYDRDHLGRLLTDPNTSRITDGLFAAGDVRHTGKMQICVATGWGCEAAMDAIAYLNKLK